jgi:predicted Zn-dependent peptidase
MHRSRHQIMTGLLAFALLALSSCSHGAPPPVAPLPDKRVVDTLQGGATLALPRPTKGVAELALWIRAGARDASPSQLATAAAYWAEEKTGAKARVLPDATELTLPCDTREQGIARCVAKLASVFVLPPPSGADASRIRERLRSTRLRALSDGGRQLDLMALEALLGDAVRTLDPLGSDEGDVKVDHASVRAFVAQHYVPGHAVLLAAGDVRPDELGQAFAKAAKGPAVALPAASPLPLRDEVRIEASDTPTISLALATPDTRQAESIAARLHGLYPGASLHVAPLRTLSVLHVRVGASSEPLKRLQRLVFDVRRLPLEPPLAEEHVRPDESLRGLVRELGESWAGRGAARELNQPWPLGVALGVADPALATPEGQAKRESWERDARAAVKRGSELAQGAIDGKVDAQAARVTAQNGASIEVQRRPGDRWFAAALRLSPGAALDPVTRHGRAALLATLMATGCGVAWGAALEAKLADLDARLEPMVDAEGLGLTVAAPREHLFEALDLLVRCALRPQLTQRVLEDARLRLLARLERTLHARAEARLAHLLAPLAPGTFAPWGAPFGVAEASLTELRRLHAETLRGQSLHVWVAGDGEPRDIARFVARRVAVLEAGEATRAAPDLGPVHGLTGELSDVAALRVTIGLRAEGGERVAHLAPDVFAHALLSAVSKRLGRPLWAVGEDRGKWAAAGACLSLREEDLPRLEQVVQDAQAELRARDDAQWDADLRAARFAHASSLSSSLGWVRSAFGDARTLGSDGEERELARKLAQATPAFFIERPRP